MKLAWLDRFMARNALRVTAVLLALFVFVLAILPYSVYSVLPGEVAVIWSRFGGGTITSRVYYEGLHTKWPWDLYYIYNVRSQVDTSDYEALTSEGVKVLASVSVRYHVIPDRAGFLQKLVGPSYLDVLIKPQIAAAVRTAISRYPTETLYNANRTEVERSIVELVAQREAALELFGFRVIDLITLSQVLLRRVILPPQLQAAIDQKMVQRQVAEEYYFRIDREWLEAERKRIEAIGIRDFQQTVGANLTDRYLRWRGIEATVRLAESPGSRLVVVGGRDGLPLILNTPGLSGEPPEAQQGAAQPPTQEPGANPSTLTSPPLPPSPDDLPPTGPPPADIRQQRPPLARTTPLLNLPIPQPPPGRTDAAPPQRSPLLNVPIPAPSHAITPP